MADEQRAQRPDRPTAGAAGGATGSAPAAVPAGLPAPVVLAGRVVTPHGVVDDGAVALVGDRVAWVGPRADAAAAGFGDVAPGDGATILPGLVDVHDHGGSGASFPDAATADEARVAARGHLRNMTVAPEVPGVVGPGGVVETLVEVGASPSIGHTDATTEQTEAAVADALAALAAAGRPGSR